MSSSCNMRRKGGDGVSSSSPAPRPTGADWTCAKVLALRCMSYLALVCNAACNFSTFIGGVRLIANLPAVDYVLR